MNNQKLTELLECIGFHIFLLYEAHEHQKTSCVLSRKDCDGSRYDKEKNEGRERWRHLKTLGKALDIVTHVHTFIFLK